MVLHSTLFSATGQQVDLVRSCHKLAAGKQAPRDGENTHQASSWKAWFFYKVDRSTRLPMLPDREVCHKKISKALVATNFQVPSAPPLHQPSTLSLLAGSPADEHFPTIPMNCAYQGSQLQAGFCPHSDRSMRGLARLKITLVT